MFGPSDSCFHCFPLKHRFVSCGGTRRREITWFAQSRQWEGTPVIRRLIEGGVDASISTSEPVTDKKGSMNAFKAQGKAEISSVGCQTSATGVDAKPTEHHECDTNCKSDTGMDAEPVAPAHILLFCRCYQQEYVYCGRLAYVAHDPSRIPMRFVWFVANRCNFQLV